MSQEFEERLTKLKKLSKDMEWRREQDRERPRAIEAMKAMLNHSEHFLASMRNLTEELQVIHFSVWGPKTRLIADLH